jgi:hypothetical protein
MSRTEKVKDLLRRTYGRQTGESDQDPMDERILTDAFTTMKQAVAANRWNKRTFIWRTIMKNNKTKWATAAAILIMATVSIHYLDSSIGGSSIVLADVIRSIQHANTAVWHEERIFTCEGEKFPYFKPDVVRHYSVEHGAKEAMYNILDKLVYEVFWLPEKDAQVWVFPEFKCYMLDELTEGECAFNGQSVEAIVELVKSEKSKRLGRKTINGREAEGFEVENSRIAGALVPIEFDSLKARFWIDIETSLPLRYEAEIVTCDKFLTLLTKGKPVNVKVVGDQFQWDVELARDVFDPNIPPDFTLLEF